MTIFWINLLVVFIVSFFARYFATITCTTNVLISIKPNKILVFVALLPLVLISGLRKDIGDTGFYKYAYKISDFTWNHIKSEKDIGFGIFQMFLKKFSDDPQIMVFTTALITNVLVILVLYKYSRLFELSMYVYITGGWYLVSMNGIRQSLAAAIIFTATKFLIEGNWKKYILIVLIASTFHQSALILIPIYFLVRFKAWSKTTFILIFCSILLVIVFNQFTSVLFAAIENTQYGQYKDFVAQGANVFRVAVYAVPLVIAYLGREKLREIYPDCDYIVNMSIINVVFMIVSTQNWIFARFSIYFGLYQIILISWIVKVFNEKDQKLVYYAILVFYFIYYYYENVRSLNIIYRSDFIKFFS
ncbi:EpsG family protein [Bacillus sp. FJAT-53711]|uniref:EpsG family protein n=1 Tax=Bacillus yunxiaonensis TaxID=3127665 RepID=A0ABU8G0X6_9BACI